jgi:hypothetical protein
MATSGLYKVARGSGGGAEGDSQRDASDDEERHKSLQPSRPHPVSPPQHGPPVGWVRGGRAGGRSSIIEASLSLQHGWRGTCRKPLSPAKRAPNRTQTQRVSMPLPAERLVELAQRWLGGIGTRSGGRRMRLMMPGWAASGRGGGGGVQTDAFGDIASIFRKHA